MTFTATIRGDGDHVDYTPASDLPAGAVVVQGDLIGISQTPIPAGKLGALRIRGLFVLPKASGTAIAAGTKLYWDATNQRVDTTDASGSNKYLGKAAAAAAAAETQIRVAVTP